MKMKTEKMSLANIQGKLSRTEMKKVMAGSGKCYVWCKGASNSAPVTNCSRSTAEAACAGKGGAESCNCS